MKKLDIIPFEFIVRGYIFGNMWESYIINREFCGKKISDNYKKAEKLKKPILTVSTKSNMQHDEYISYECLEQKIGVDLSKKIKKVCMELYEKCYSYAYERGIIIADTKFEFGLDENGKLVLADEIFTPDCSRFWSLDDYTLGESPNSYDKQFIRDWLINNTIDGKIQFNNVPEEIIIKTNKLYYECRQQLIANHRDKEIGKGI